MKQIIPVPQKVRFIGRKISLPQGTPIVLGRKASPQEEYAAEMLHTYVEKLYGLHMPVINEGDEGRWKSPRILIGTPETNATLKSRCKDIRMPVKLSSLTEQAFIIASVGSGKNTDILLIGGGGPGTIYSCTAFLQTMGKSGDGFYVNQVILYDRPLVAVRGGSEIPYKMRSFPLEDLRYFRHDYTDYLDWMALSRLNYFFLHLPSNQELPTGYERLLEEVHRRGIQIYAQFSQRYEKMCYSKEKEVKKRLKILRQALQKGADGIAILYDDLRPNYYSGHCPGCRAKFGSMGGEQAYFVKRVVELASEFGKQENIDVCPTLYWRGWEEGISSAYSRDYYLRRSEEGYLLKNHGGGKAYFSEFGSDKRLSKVNMWHCSYEAQQVKALHKAGLQNYSWWYNGVRPLYYMYPSPPHMSPRFTKKGWEWDFPKLYWGWYLTRRKKGKEPVISKGVMSELRSMHEKTRRIFLCTGNPRSPAEYNSSLWGSFAWNPREFDEIPCEKLAFEQIFGRGAYPLANRWNRIYRESLIAVRVKEIKISPARLRAKLKEGRESVKELGRFHRNTGSLLDSETVNNRYLVPMRNALSRLERIIR